MRVRKRRLLGVWLLGLAVLVCLATISCEPKHIQTTPQGLKQTGPEGQANKETTPLSKEQIIAIADAVAGERGWWPDERLDYDRGHREWKEYIQKEFGQGRRTGLEGHDYQAVRYVHRRSVFDGDLSVLIDKNTGEVLWIVGW